MSNTPSSQELAREAIEVLKKNPMTSEEHFEFLVKQGIIDRNGRVICAKLFGKGADQDSPPASGKNGQ